jgi:hypothetical protein
MEFDALTLSRLQFAFTIASHIIFPAFTIGLASWLVSLEFKWLGTGNALYRNLFRFWGDGGVSNDGLRRRGHVGLDDPARALGSRPRRSRARGCRCRWPCGSPPSLHPFRLCWATCTDSTSSPISRPSSPQLRPTGRRSPERRSFSSLGPRRDRHPEARQLHPDSRFRRHGAGLKGRAAAGAAAGLAGVLVVPHHGGNRASDGGARLVEPVAALERRPVRGPLVFCVPPWP